jgi:hypothetical protein
MDSFTFLATKFYSVTFLMHGAYFCTASFISDVDIPAVIGKLILLYADKKTPWPESASELYRLSDLSLSAKLVPALADRG